MPAKPVTNNADISLEMAVWALFDDYDFVRDEKNYISATRLMRPVRHIVLPPRIPPELMVPGDVEDCISAAMGQALHAGVEKAWTNGNHLEGLRKLGYPEEVISRVFVNPTAEQLARAKDPIVVWIEQRAMKKIIVDGIEYTVGGKFDMTCEGRVTDTKSTSVWGWIKGGEEREENYRLQMSIYRWLNPDKITEDHGRINFIFTDWSKLDASQKKNYPPHRVMHKDILLMSAAETEAWIAAKLRLIARCRDLPEKQIPECTPDELWMSPPQFKYYLDATKATAGYRSTRNFDSALEAEAFKAEKGGRGVVLTVAGTPRRCGYCDAYPVCTQKDHYALG